MSTNEHNQLLDDFRNDAQAYCDFIDAWRAGNVSKPYVELLQLLSNLAKSGVSIPFDMPEKDVDQVERIQWEIIWAEIHEVTSAASSALMREHADNENAKTRAFMLWDDLADIYRDLRHGLDLFNLGGTDAVAEATWEWRFGYENHWGAHLFRALTTVHEIRYRLFME